jgi:hypothetical protein
MAYYRLYQLHGPRNEVQGFEEFEASDDDEAMTHAERFWRLNPMELWSEHRKVRRWDCVATGEDSRPTCDRS